MKLLNREWIKVDDLAICSEIVKGMDSKNERLISFFQNLLFMKSEYERKNNLVRGDVYISVSELCNKDLLSVNDIPIDTELLKYIVTLALSEDNFVVAKALSTYLHKGKEVSINDIGEDIANYIFDNCDRYDDFFSGKSTRVVYSEKENKLEERTIKPIQRANLKKLEKN